MDCPDCAEEIDDCVCGNGCLYKYIKKLETENKELKKEIQDLRKKMKAMYYYQCDTLPGGGNF